MLVVLPRVPEVVAIPSARHAPRVWPGLQRFRPTEPATRRAAKCHPGQAGTSSFARSTTVEFVAIVERSLTDWHVDIPALAIGGPVPEPYDVQAFAVALVAAATGLPAAGVEVSLYSTV